VHDVARAPSAPLATPMLQRSFAAPGDTTLVTPLGPTSRKFCYVSVTRLLMLR